MTAKEYLYQLEKLDTKINQKLEELTALKQSATSITVATDTERVQTSGTSDRVGTLAVKIADMRKEIDMEIDGFVDKKHRIINQIHTLSDSKHMKLLFKKYVQFKSLELIAVEMGYTYQYIVELHGYALNEFKKTYKNL